MKILLLVVACLFCTITFSQPTLFPQWQQTFQGPNGYNNSGYSVLNTTGGGYIAAGNLGYYDGSYNNVTHAYIVRFDGQGNQLWARLLDSIGFTERRNALTATNDGGYVITGSQAKTRIKNGYPYSSADVCIIKLDSAGNIQWKKTYGGSVADNGLSAQPAEDGGYVIAASVYSVDGDVTSNHGYESYRQAWVFKIDSSGNIQWQHCYSNEFGVSVTAIDFKPIPGGGYLLAVFNNRGLNYDLYKITSTGQTLWKSALYNFNWYKGVSLSTSTDGYIIAGGTDEDITNSDYHVTKLDTAGNYIWDKQYGGSADDIATCVQQARDGGYVIAGASASADGDVTGHNGGVGTNTGKYDCWLVKLDTAGNISWQQSIGTASDEIPHYIQNTPDSGFIITGFSGSYRGSYSSHSSGSEYYSYFWTAKLLDRPVAKTVQSIVFPPLPVKTVTDNYFTPQASATSGLPVIFTSSDTSIAYYQAGRIFLKKAGTVSITAIQNGDSVYYPAIPVTQTLTIVKKAQVITFQPIALKILGDSDFVPATINSPLPLTFVISDTSVVSVVGGMIHIKDTGVARITATQPGDDKYSAATPVTQVLTVKLGQTITFLPMPFKNNNDRILRRLHP